MKEYWNVEFYNLHTKELEHNTIISSFSEMAELSQGRIAIINGKATEEEYIEEMEIQ